VRRAEVWLVDGCAIALPWAPPGSSGAPAGFPVQRPSVQVCRVALPLGLLLLVRPSGSASEQETQHPSRPWLIAEPSVSRNEILRANAIVTARSAFAGLAGDSRSGLRAVCSSRRSLRPSSMMEISQLAWLVHLACAGEAGLERKASSCWRAQGGAQIACLRIGLRSHRCRPGWNNQGVCMVKLSQTPSPTPGRKVQSPEAMLVLATAWWRNTIAVHCCDFEVLSSMSRHNQLPSLQKGSRTALWAVARLLTAELRVALSSTVTACRGDAQQQ